MLSKELITTAPNSEAYTEGWPMPVAAAAFNDRDCDEGADDNDDDDDNDADADADDSDEGTFKYRGVEVLNSYSDTLPLTAVKPLPCRYGPWTSISLTGTTEDEDEDGDVGVALTVAAACSAGLGTRGMRPRSEWFGMEVSRSTPASQPREGHDGQMDLSEGVCR